MDIFVETISSSVVARFPIAAAAAQGILAELTDALDCADTVVSVFEDAERWSVAIHFGSPPNETATRALIVLTDGADTLFDQPRSRWLKNRDLHKKYDTDSIPD